MSSEVVPSEYPSQDAGNPEELEHPLLTTTVAWVSPCVPSLRTAGEPGAVMMEGQGVVGVQLTRGGRGEGANPEPTNTTKKRPQPSSQHFGQQMGGKTRATAEPTTKKTS